MSKLIKVNVATASGPVLDWMVATLEKEPVQIKGKDVHYGPGQFSDEGLYAPSDDVNIACAIMQRDKIQTRYIDSPGHASHGLWLAQDCRFRPESQSVSWVKFGKSYAELQTGYMSGETMLIAVMRYHVAKHMGLEVEVPKALVDAHKAR